MSQLQAADEHLKTAEFHLRAASDKYIRQLEPVKHRLLFKPKMDLIAPIYKTTNDMMHMIEDMFLSSESTQNSPFNIFMEKFIFKIFLPMFENKTYVILEDILEGKLTHIVQKCPTLHT